MFQRPISLLALAVSSVILLNLVFFFKNGKEFLLTHFLLKHFSESIIKKNLYKNDGNN